MKLRYWLCKIKDDAPCYSIRELTKREAEVRRQEHGAERFEEPKLIIVDYESGFDLMCQCLSEGGLIEEGH